MILFKYLFFVNYFILFNNILLMLIIWLFFNTNIIMIMVLDYFYFLNSFHNSFIIGNYFQLI